jgi:hypothetical protein
MVLKWIDVSSIGMAKRQLSEILLCTMMMVYFGRKGIVGLEVRGVVGSTNEIGRESE